MVKKVEQAEADWHIRSRKYPDRVWTDERNALYLAAECGNYIHHASVQDNKKAVKQAGGTVCKLCWRASKNPFRRAERREVKEASVDESLRAHLRGFILRGR